MGNKPVTNTKTYYNGKDTGRKGVLCITKDIHVCSNIESLMHVKLAANNFLPMHNALDEKPMSIVNQSMHVREHIMRRPYIGLVAAI